MAASKYTLFPNLHFLTYCKKVHIAYKPGSQKTDLAKRLVLQCSSETIKKQFPDLEFSWEFLSYDAPASLSYEFFNGEKDRLLINQYSRAEQKQIAQDWALSSNMEPMQFDLIDKKFWAPMEENAPQYTLAELLPEYPAY